MSLTTITALHLRRSDFRLITIRVLSAQCIILVQGVLIMVVLLITLVPVVPVVPAVPDIMAVVLTAADFLSLQFLRFGGYWGSTIVQASSASETSKLCLLGAFDSCEDKC